MSLLSFGVSSTFPARNRQEAAITHLNGHTVDDIKVQRRKMVIWNDNIIVLLLDKLQLDESLIL